MHRDWLLIRAAHRLDRSATTYPAGSLLAANYDEFLSGTAELTVVFEPDEHTSLHHYAWTRDRLVLVTLADVASRRRGRRPPATWQREPVPGLPPNTNTVIVDADELRRRDLPGLQWFRSPRRGCCTGRAERRASRDQERTGVLRRRRHRGQPALRDVGRRHADPVLRGRRTATRRARADAARRLRRFRDSRARRATTACWAGCGWPAAAPTCWPTSAAAASTGRAGTPRRCGRAGTWSYEDFAAVARDLVDRGHHDRRTARRPGRQQRRPADGHHADPVPGAVRRAGVQRAAAGHAALPPAAGRRVLGRRVRRPGQPRRLGVHLQILAVPEYFGRSRPIRRC